VLQTEHTRKWKIQTDLIAYPRQQFLIFPCLFYARLFKQDGSLCKCVTDMKYPNIQQYYVTRILLHVAMLFVCVRACYFSYQSWFRNWSLGSRISTFISKKWIELYWTIFCQVSTVLFRILGTFRHSLFSIFFNHDWQYLSLRRFIPVQ